MFKAFLPTFKFQFVFKHFPQLYNFQSFNFVESSFSQTSNFNFKFWFQLKSYECLKRLFHISVAHICPHFSWHFAKCLSHLLALRFISGYFGKSHKSCCYWWINGFPSSIAFSWGLILNKFVFVLYFYLYLFYFVFVFLFVLYLFCISYFADGLLEPEAWN